MILAIKYIYFKNLTTKIGLFLSNEFLYKKIADIFWFQNISNDFVFYIN